MGIFHKQQHGTDDPVVADHDDRPPWGRPSRCPECRQAGYLDRIDLVDRVMWQHCPDCRAMWSTAEADCLQP